MIYHNNTAEQVNLLVRHEAALRSNKAIYQQDSRDIVIKVSDVLWTMVLVLGSLILV